MPHSSRPHRDEWECRTFPHLAAVAFAFAVLFVIPEGDLLWLWLWLWLWPSSSLLLLPLAVAVAVAVAVARHSGAKRRTSHFRGERSDPSAYLKQNKQVAKLIPKIPSKFACQAHKSPKSIKTKGHPYCAGVISKPLQLD
ncbi:MAG TPA: hypothetical protein VK578_17235 [Edaphobacter sp.]|nr:hypothetical protein [Edaphobacter sp.]